MALHPAIKSVSSTGHKTTRISADPLLDGLADPVASEERICFGIKWFASEAEADQYAAYVRFKGLTYNGGMFDGMACGRNKSFDKRTDGVVTAYAVTD